MTVKLYWVDSYKQEFEAEVISLTEDGIILNQTLFYPFSGNQLNDKGYLLKEKLRIDIEKVNLEDDEIIHHISPNFLDKIKVGDKVVGKIDWEYRYGLMKSHTSQHIFSAIVKKNFDADTIRANIDFEEVSLHISKEISLDQLKSVLREINEICVLRNLNINSRMVSDKEVKTFSNKVRGIIPDKKKIRIIEIEHLDSVCCGGTHIHNSTEIGLLFIYEFKKKKEIKYYVGNKSLRAFTELNVDMLGSANFLEIPLSKLNTQIKKRQQEISSLLKQNQEMIMDILTLTSSNPTAKFDDITIYILELEVDHRILRKAFNEYPSNSLLFLKMTNNRVKILSKIERVGANGILQSLISKYGGKGGGNPASAQGTLEEELINIISELESILM